MSDAELNDLIADIAAGHEEPEAGELPATWATLVDLGLPLVGIAEEHGGSGGSVADLVVLAGALGRHGMSTPFVEASAASWALAADGQDPRAGLHTVTLDRSCAVPWARHADSLVFTGGDDVLHAGLDDPAVRIRQDISVSGEPWDFVEHGTVPAARVLGSPSADQLCTRLGLLRAAALTGAIQGAYELTRDYVSTRRQFDKPLIRIPAVATNLARIKTALLQCEAGLARAADERLTSVAAARVLAGRAATETARLAHQLHGAMGITAEYPLRRFTARLWAWRDADLDQRGWSMLLGTLAVRGGETAFWEELTSDTCSSESHAIAERQPH